LKNNGILGNVSWGKPALTLLKHSGQLDFEYPSIMVIRHSERQEPKEIEKIHRAQITETGKKCAKRFGQLLPTNINYCIYHSISERTEDTATEIHQGIIKNGGQSILKGQCPVLSHILQYQDSFNEYLSMDMGDFFNNWISGLYPPYKLEDSKQFAKRFAHYAFKELLTAKNNDMHIYVSHDIFILNYMFHWFGINLASEWLKYLDGFILQIKNNVQHIYYKKGLKLTRIPYWLER